MNAAPAAVQILSTPGELQQSAADWDSLPQAIRDPLLGHRWFSAAAAHLHAPGELHVVTVRRRSQLVAIAPLVRTRRSGVTRLEFIGSRVLQEPCDLLALDPVAHTQLCTALVAAGHPLMLQRVPAESGIDAALRTVAAGRGRVLVAASAPVRCVEMAGNWDAYLAGRSPGLAAGLRRKRRRLERLGPVILDALRPAPSELRSVLDEAFDVEADGWKGASGSALRNNDRLRRFVIDVAERFAIGGDLRVNFLRAGDRAVAMGILIEFNQRLWEIKIGYRQLATSASPGRLLLSETLREACGRGLHGYEFLGSGDRQQLDWANAGRSLHTVVYYPYTASGLWAFAADLFSRLMRRLRRRTRAAMSHIDARKSVRQAAAQPAGDRT